MCAVGAVALYIVKGGSVKSRKAGTVKNRFSIILDAGSGSLKYRGCLDNKPVSVCCTKEEAVGYVNKVRKNYEEMESDGAVYEGYIS